jgi:hypothetical protein
MFSAFHINFKEGWPLLAFTLSHSFVETNSRRRSFSWKEIILHGWKMRWCLDGASLSLFCPQEKAQHNKSTYFTSLLRPSCLLNQLKLRCWRGRWALNSWSGRWSKFMSCFYHCVCCYFVLIQDVNGLLTFYSKNRRLEKQRSWDCLMITKGKFCIPLLQGL